MFNEIEDFLMGKNISRVKLANIPTPLEEAKNLSAFLGGPKIFFKRDDLTGLCCGGNKVRKLEFLMAHAISKKADYIVTGGGTQSNHAAQTAAVCAKLNIKVRLVLKKPDKMDYDGNLLLEELMGAETVFVSVEKVEDLNRAIEEEVNLLRAEGHNPYGIPLGGSTPPGVISYAMAAGELKKQAEEKNLKIHRIFTACGTGGTIAGLILGKKIFNMPAEITGISVGAVTEDLKNTVSSLIKESAGMLNCEDLCFPEPSIYEDYIGPGYGQVDERTIEAIKMVAGKEGLFLDPVYTGKCMAGLIDLVKRGEFRKEENIVFIHTGGLPGLFAYKKDLLPGCEYTSG